jgi:hypothetical protein
MYIPKVPTFTIEEGLKAQADNLKFWKKNLKPTRYAKLVKELNKAQNKIDVKSGSDVLRGNDFDNLIYNKLR